MTNCTKCVPETKEADRLSGQPQKNCRRILVNFVPVKPSLSEEGFTGLFAAATAQVTYCAALAACFLCTGAAARGLRAWGFTTDSSTAAVPATSAVKVAPAGTR